MRAALMTEGQVLSPSFDAAPLLAKLQKNLDSALLGRSEVAQLAMVPLLEAMSDRQISVDGQTRPLGPPFLVLATQNPFEFEGTYPLPESQLDRFLLRLKIGYPARAAEKQVQNQHRAGEPVEQLGPVL